jgi:hypothetical protein
MFLLGVKIIPASFPLFSISPLGYQGKDRAGDDRKASGDARTTIKTLLLFENHPHADIAGASGGRFLRLSFPLGIECGCLPFSTSIFKGGRS